MSSSISKTADLTLDYKLVPTEDVPAAYSIEIAEYPEGEPASLKTLLYRQGAVHELFLGCYSRPADAGQEQVTTLAGYVCSTLASGERLTHDSMLTHDPSGNAVCIHSVCVAKAYQRRGLASATLRQYLEHVRSLQKTAPGFHQVDRVLLIVHDYLISLYAGVGFKLVGRSNVEWGPDPWFEMEYIL